MKRCPWPLVCNVRLLAAGLIMVAGSGSLGARDWTDEDCARFGVSEAPESVSCGYVSIPLRHGQPGGETISLAVMVIEASGPDRQPDPLFIAQGGPGGSTLDTFAGILVSDPAYRPVSNRDLVLWDQRGTLYSRPFLGCPEVAQADLRSMLATESPESSAGVDDDESMAPYLACQRRLSTLTSDLSAFNSVENANDVEALRIALGYETVNFYGVSYGTELGQYLIRQHPDKVRSVVLDAVVPTDFNLITDVPYVQQRIGEKYFGSCAADAWCDEAFPDLGSRFLDLLDRLDETPVVLEVRNPSDPDGTAYPVRLDGGLLAGILYQALYMTELQPLIPYLIDRADQGDFDFLQHALLPMTLFDDTGSTGMYITVVCAGHGDVSADGLDYGGLAERLRRDGRESAGALLEICEAWGIEPLPNEIHEPVRSAVPALLLSGDYDPITPPAFAAAVGAGLQNDFEITFPSGSHGQAFSSECANSIIQSFLDAPGQWPGGACANASPDDYITPGDIIVIPAVRDAVTQADSGGLAAMLRGFSPVLIGLAILATAVPVYAIGGIVALFRNRPANGAAGREGASGWLSRRAGLIALLCLTALAGFLIFLVYALIQSAAWEPVVLYLGAIHSSYGWIAWLGLAAVVMTVLLMATAAAAWISGQRTPAGRIYLTVLALAAGGALAGLYRLGLLPTAWGG
jgi:pimeloyl-ACP methyl ester carboxylesterase